MEAVVIKLKNGGYLKVCGQEITCWDANRNMMPLLTAGQLCFVRKLIENLNTTVSYVDAYEAYASKADPYEAASRIQRLKGTLSACLLESIVTMKKRGYKLEGEILEENLPLELAQSCKDAEPASFRYGMPADLAGDYYGYYLDPIFNPTGAITVLGARLRIVNHGTQQEPDLAAFAVYGIRKEDLLHSDSVEEVFSGNEEDYRYNFVKNHTNPSWNHQNLFFAQGKVIQDGNMITILLSNPMSLAKWQIILDMESFYKCKRFRDLDEDLYQGGLGLVVATNAAHGTRCFRFGLVRSTCMKAAIKLESSELRGQLQLIRDHRDAACTTLVLGKTWDKEWHHWLMSE